MKKQLLKILYATILLNGTLGNVTAQAGSPNPSQHTDKEEEYFPYPNQELQAIYNEVRSDMGLDSATLMAVKDSKKADMGELFASRTYDPTKRDSLDFKVVMSENFEKLIPTEDLKVFLSHELGHLEWYLQEKLASGQSAETFFGKDALTNLQRIADERFADSTTVTTYGYERFVKAFHSLSVKEIHLYRESLREFIKRSDEFCYLTGTAEEPIIKIEWDKFPNDPLEYDSKIDGIYPWAQMLEQTKKFYDKKEGIKFKQITFDASLMTDLNYRSKAHPAGSIISRKIRAEHWKDKGPKNLSNTENPNYTNRHKHHIRKGQNR